MVVFLITNPCSQVVDRRDEAEYLLRTNFHECRIVRSHFTQKKCVFLGGRLYFQLMDVKYIIGGLGWLGSPYCCLGIPLESQTTGPKTPIYHLFNFGWR